MADFNDVQPDIMIAAAQAGADAIAEVLSRTFEKQCQITAGAESEAFLGAEAVMMTGRCLVLQAEVEGGCVVAVLPAVAGLAPAWCGAPDDTEKAKLGALAQEFFFSVLPEDFPPTDQRIDFVDEVSAIDQISFADAANFIRLKVEGEIGKGSLLLIWPATAMVELPPGVVTEFDLMEEAEADEASSDSPAAGDGDASESGAGQASARKRIAYSTVAEGLQQLPTYARNLLKIPVNVSAVLASKKMSVEDVYKLSPGTIIEFDKSCEETLTLEVGDQLIAEGEAVRVGERFGIWVTQISLPDERFSCANRRRGEAS